MNVDVLEVGMVLRRGVLIAVTTVAMAAAATLVTLQPAYAASVTATFVKTSTWSTGFEGKYTITNGTTATITSWRVEFTMPAGTTVGTYWDALLASSSGGRYAFTNREYNGTLAPGASASFGFVAAGTGSPTNCTVNGGPCGGGTPPPPPPPPPSSSAPPPPPPPPPTTTGPPPPPPPPTTIPRHAMVGYLHASFANGSGYVRMADVPAAWDVVNLAFAEPTTPTSGQLRFNLCPVAECPNVETEAQFISAIRAKQAQGKKVLISVGGANGQVQLTTTAARDAFVTSAAAIIDRFGLDGIDIDFEGHSLSLNANDTNFRSPTTPVIVNLIAALRSLKTRYGARFTLTMAPETFFVQLGYTNYGPGPFGGDPRAGAYLPVIHALRNDLTLLHVQHYNSGPIMGLDNQFHFMGGADFHIAMADMVLTGFPIRQNPNDVFPALRPDQVAIGLPAGPQAGNGWTPVAAVQQALNCLTKNQTCGGYALRGGTKPALRGLMSWSVNWDRFYGFEFSNSHEPFLNSLP